MNCGPPAWRAAILAAHWNNGHLARCGSAGIAIVYAPLPLSPLPLPRLLRPKRKRSWCREAESYDPIASISQRGRGHRSLCPFTPGLMAAHCGKPFAGTNFKTVMRPRHQNGILLSLSSSAVMSSDTASTDISPSSRSRRSAVRSDHAFKIVQCLQKRDIEERLRL